MDENMTQPAPQQPVTQQINFINKPTKRDIILAVRQLLVEQGFSVEGTVKPEIEKIIGVAIRESINKLINSKHFEELVINTALVGALAEKKHFDSCYGWQRRIKDLVTKALVDKLASDFTVQIMAKPVATPAPTEQPTGLPGSDEYIKALREYAKDLSEKQRELPHYEQTFLSAQASGDAVAGVQAKAKLANAIQSVQDAQATIASKVKAMLDIK